MIKIEKKNIEGTVLVNPHDHGILYVQPCHEVGEELNISPSQMDKFMKENKLPLTYIPGLGFGLSNIEIEKLRSAFAGGKKND